MSKISPFYYPIIFSVTIYSKILYACPDNQYQQCYLGACLCLPKVGGDVGEITEDLKEEVVNPIQEIVEPVLPNLSEEIGICLSNLKECPNEIVDRIPNKKLISTCIERVSECPKNILRLAPDQVVNPIIDNYKDGLLRQAKGKWKKLPDDFIYDFDKFYKNISLDDIRYATNIKTGHGSGITIGYEIFFPRSLNLNEKSDRKWMLHELEHSVQYSRRGGESLFLSSYVMDSLYKIINCRCLNIHDDIQLEQDAENKAKEITNKYGWSFKVKNSCNSNVKFALRYLNSNDEWIATNWYTIEEDDSRFLAKIHSANKIFYYYAYSPKTGHFWKGDGSHMREVDGKKYSFREEKIDSDDEYAFLNFVCIK